jgi:hypothetical protein
MFCFRARYLQINWGNAQAVVSELLDHAVRAASCGNGDSVGSEEMLLPHDLFPIVKSMIGSLSRTAAAMV